MRGGLQDPGPVFPHNCEPGTCTLTALARASTSRIVRGTPGLDVCGDGAVGGALDPEICFQVAISANGLAGNNRVGENGCFFEGPGQIPESAADDIGLAVPPDDDRDNDGDAVIDEYVTANGPKRNFDLQDQPWNGPDMRFNTLEDFFGDAGNTFQGALGFVLFQGAVGNASVASYGEAIDDMVVEWREFELVADATDCVAGACATIEVQTTNVFEGNTQLSFSVLESSPSGNDCDDDGTTDTGCTARLRNVHRLRRRRV